MVKMISFAFWPPSPPAPNLDVPAGRVSSPPAAEEHDEQPCEISGSAALGGECGFPGEPAGSVSIAALTGLYRSAPGPSC
jgi:hypothetical protein